MTRCEGAHGNLGRLSKTPVRSKNVLLSFFLSLSWKTFNHTDTHTAPKQNCAAAGSRPLLKAPLQRANVPQRPEAPRRPRCQH